MISSNRQESRRHLGGDFYLEALDPGSAEKLRVDVGFEHSQWRPRRAGIDARSAFPGSALRIDDRWYEIVRVETAAGSPSRTSYYLEPWEDAATLRHPYELTPAVCAEVTRQHWRQQRRRATGEMLALFPFLLGALPAKEQRWIENRFGVPAVRNTAISAVLLLAVSTLVGLCVFAYGQGHDFGALHGLIQGLAPWTPLFAYLGIESGYRLVGAAGNDPVGSLPVALPVSFIRWLKDHLSASGQRSAAARKAGRGRAERFATYRDRVERRSGKCDLEVISRLPKEHWTANVTGIHYRGEAYVLIERSVVETDDGARHRFLLKKPEHEVLFKSVTEYNPEEVRDIYRAHRRLDAAMWVETFAILWGFLDQETQLRIGHIYNYDPWRVTRRTIFSTAVLAVLVFIEATDDMIQSAATTSDAVQFFGGIFLVWEAVLRWRDYKAGKIRPSVLGLPWLPLARRALRWE